MPTQYEISLNPTSAKGDILSFNGSSRSRISAGSNGQILTARSSASSGAQFETITAATADFALVSSSVLTANSATVVFSSIPLYKYLKIVCFASSATTNGAEPRIFVNAVTSGYTWSAYERTTTDYQVNSVTTSAFFKTTAYDGHTGSGILLEIDIYGANNSSASLLFQSKHAMVQSAASTRRQGMSVGRLSTGVIVTSVTFSLGSTDVYGTGSEFSLYGRA